MTLYVYVDDSNIWIEGQRIQAVRTGLAPDIRAALERKITAPWTYDFGRLYGLLCPPGVPVGRSIVFGSSLPVTTSDRTLVADTVPRLLMGKNAPPAVAASTSTLPDTAVTRMLS